MSNRYKFQGKCLVNEEGYRCMYEYDNLPPDVRLRLQSSDFNLCAACVARTTDPHIMISKMEAALRAESNP